MRKTSKIILVTIVATCILLGLGYAAISNITLNIAGSASAAADQANFKVRFTGTPVVSDSVAATASITSDHAATISVQGLTTAGQYITATYEIENESQDLSADLRVETTNNNKEYFIISSKLDKSSLKAGESTTALVTVKLTKTPIDGDVSSNIGVTLTAMPVEPGKEGTSVGINDFSSSPISRETNEYGFYYEEAYTLNDGSMYPSSLVFYEDGYMEVYSGENLFTFFSADVITYNENFIKIDSDNNKVEIIVSDNGNTLAFDGNVYELNDSFMDRQEQYTGELNEYGFYYDVPYVMGLQDSETVMVFQEDSKISRYEYEGIYTEEESVTYSNGKIIRDSGSEMKIFGDGRIIFVNDILAFKARSNYDFVQHVYITTNSTTGKLEYLDRFPDVHKINDMYVVGDYVYTYKSNGWKMGVITDGSKLPNDYVFSGNVLDSYCTVLNSVNNILVTDMENAFAGCTNLKVAPELPYNVTNMRGAFDGCTSLTTFEHGIIWDVKDVTNAFRGCTSLEGEIEIDSDNIIEYAGCFEGVDMSKITLTGSASNATKNKLGRTGLNYVDLPEY